MSVYISVQLRRKIPELFSYCCAYCHTAERLTVAIFEIEHVEPHSAGGKTDLTNLCFAYPTCNRYKGLQQLAVDPLNKNNVSLFHPINEQWQEHFAWNDGYSKIIGLMATGRATIAALKMNRPQLVRLRQMWVNMGEHPLTV